MIRLDRFSYVAALLAPLVFASLAGAQDSVSVAPGPHYHADGLRALILGSGYRTEWSTPVRVPVLDLERYAGGLTPEQRGGGNQTVSLRFRGGDGREYTFRSVDKFPRLPREPALIDTPGGALIQDQVSSIHPAAALMLPPILSAVGILHPEPTLAVMPDDPALGQFREEFAGMVGLIEERPDEREGDLPGFGGFTKIVGTTTLIERLEESPDNRLDETGYLTARLVDLMVGDWDRHYDQWRWAEVEEGGGITRYRPIPRDRDYAFADYDGWLMVVGRNFVSNAVRFSRSYELEGLTRAAWEIDHSLLTGLERQQWDSVTAYVQSSVTDGVIQEAVSRLPTEFQGERSEEIADILRWRRDNLGEVAADFYRRLATEVDVRATDLDDLARIERVAPAKLRIRLFRRGEGDVPAGEAYFDRTFDEEETHEVRLYLHGGDDLATVTGEGGNSVMVRIIGGGGDDRMENLSPIRGLTAFYDDRGENEFDTGVGTPVDRRPYDGPDRVELIEGTDLRDWGAVRSWSPSVDYQSTEGPVLGAVRRHTRYGFRQSPYAFSVSVKAEIGTRTGAVGLGLEGDFKRVGRPGGFHLELSASQLDPLHYYGAGNDTEADESSDFYVVRQNRARAFAAWYRDLGATARVYAGPVAGFTRSQLPEGSPYAAAAGGERHTAQLGAQARFLFDTRDASAFPTRGVKLEVQGAGYPAVWNIDGPFGSVRAVGSAYFTPGSDRAPTLAVRAGGSQVWGDHPPHESAFLGGSATVRGYRYQRYAGDAVVFGNAEARLPLTQVQLIARGDLGVLGLADAGRVYVDGESPGDWHTAYGGGLWLRYKVRSSVIAATAAYVQGDHGTLYLDFGVPF